MKMFITLAALAAGAFAVPAYAEETVTTTRSQTVRVADLNMANPAHIAEFDRRVAATVRSLCSAPAHFDLGVNALASQRCRAEALKQVAVQRDQLIAAHSRIGEAVAAR